MTGKTLLPPLLCIRRKESLSDGGGGCWVCSTCGADDVETAAALLAPTHFSRKVTVCLQCRLRHQYNVLCKINSRAESSLTVFDCSCEEAPPLPSSARRPTEWNLPAHRVGRSSGSRWRIVDRSRHPPRAVYRFRKF